jgi:NADPH2:quinone reductase
VDRFGGPEVLVPREVPDPVAGPGQVVVGVAAADTLFVETQIRQGRATAWFDVRPPFVPGGGVAGTVLSVGTGVDPAVIGTRVITRTARGAYAERTLTGADELTAVPDELSDQHAAALVHDGLTALALAEAVRIRPDEWVLVTAAAGGMGVLLVQLARNAGARVVAAARGAGKLELASDLGATEAVDYTEPGWTERVRTATGGTGVDVVLDGAGGQPGLDAFGVTAPGGRFSAHGAAAGGFAAVDRNLARERGITLRGITDIHAVLGDSRRLTERALAEAAAGRITPVVGRTFPLERAADAHAAIEAREVLGKALLLV